MAYIETPRTDAGNATYMTNAHNLENLSDENSFLPPSKGKDDLLSQLRKGRGQRLNTSHSRAPLANRYNLPAAPAQGEFTPLLKSVTKKNLLRKEKSNGAPQTPAFLKPGYKGIASSPALPRVESSAIFEEGTGSSMEMGDEETPVPRVASSSAQSTPLAMLPKRDGGGVLTDQANMLTLREQENIVNKIEKENWGLKLKISFLEDSLRRAGPGFNEAALKENTELKVNKVTMLKELSRTRKTLNQAERDIEAYRLHLQEVQEKMKQKNADEGMREESDRLRKAVDSKDTEIRRLLEKLESANGRNEENTKLRDDVGDLEAEVREKCRAIEERDDELDRLQLRSRTDSDTIKRSEEELKIAHNQVEELKRTHANEVEKFEDELNLAHKHIGELNTTQQRSIEQASELTKTRSNLKDAQATMKTLESRLERTEAALQKAEKERQEAVEETDKVNEDLDELRGEMSDKSFTTRGLSRQLEEKANSLHDELIELREKHAGLEEDLDEKTREANELEERLHEIGQDANMRESELRNDNDRLHRELDAARNRRESISPKMRQTVKDLHARSEEKDLLQVRHDALTKESQDLQRDLLTTQVQARELQRKLEDEQHQALNNDRILRNQAKHDIARLTAEIDDLRREIEDKGSELVTSKDLWESQRKALESQKEKADERARGLQRTVEKLQQTEGTLSGRELKLQEALESEQQRHRSEETVLSRQLEELREDINDRRHVQEQLRLELSTTKEDLRISRRDQDGLEEKISALEDEIDVMQNSLDDEAERANKDVSAARQEAESLRQQSVMTKQELARLEAGYFEAKAEIDKFQSNLRAGQGWKEQADSRLRDTECQLQRIKDERQALQDKLANMTIELHSLRALTVDVDAERNEITRMRELLVNANQQNDSIRAQSKDAEREARRNYSALEREAQAKIDDQDRQRERLEQEIADCHLMQEDLTAEKTIIEQTVERLRIQIRDLERDIESARLRATSNRTIAEERRDLHDLLKDAKLEAEEFQLQILERDSRLESGAKRVSELLFQIKRIREERNHQAQKCRALTIELESLQTRHDRAVEEFSEKQQGWEEERKAASSRVRFPNSSLACDPGTMTEFKGLKQSIRINRKKHEREMTGLAKQIEWMQAKCNRERWFRSALVYEKNYLSLQIQMYEACNQVDLQMLDKMGIKGDPELYEKKRPTLRAAGLMVMAIVRLQKMRSAWADQKKNQASLLAKMEKKPHLRKGSRR